jgi:hypothetical protein
VPSPSKSHELVRDEGLKRAIGEMREHHVVRENAAPLRLEIERRAIMLRPVA